MKDATTLRYRSRQPIPINVIQALLFTGKIGFLSRDLWSTFFGEGSERWQYQQLAYLIERGYLRPHSNPEARSTFVLGKKGIEFVQLQRGSLVTPPPVTYLTHDGVVTKSMRHLQELSLLKKWSCEKEMKRDGVKDFLVSERDGDLKYPDAVFEIHAYGKSRTVAFEYERQRKSFSRYKGILWQYSGLTNLSMVIFAYEKAAIKTTIEAAMKYLGGTTLTDRLAFVDAEEWKRTPENADIFLRSGKIKLADICGSTPAEIAA